MHHILHNTMMSSDRQNRLDNDEYKDTRLFFHIWRIAIILLAGIEILFLMDVLWNLLR